MTHGVDVKRILSGERSHKLYYATHPICRIVITLHISISAVHTLAASRKLKAVQNYKIALLL